MKNKLIAISLAAIVVVSFVAAMPTALGQGDVNLTVTRIDPKYVFADLDNVIIGYVKNTGADATTTGNVCLVVTNAAGVVYSETNTENLPVAAGATVEVKFQWMPTTLEDVTLTVTADCDSDVAETDETDNSRSEVRNSTGNCAINTALPTTWMLPATCWGYRGQNTMDTVIEGSGSGNLIFTTGDYKYKKTTVTFTIGDAGDPNRVITGATADIPDGAAINMARLYVYYCWRDNVVFGYPDLGMELNGNPVSEDVNYTDWKGFGLRTYYGYGTIAYDVTNLVTGDGVYTAEITGSEWVPYQWKKGAVSGMALLIAYTDTCDPYDPYIEYYVDEGCDRLANYYWYWNDKAAKDYKRWHYYVAPESATTTASFPCIDNPPEEIVKATLFTATIDGVDYNYGTPGKETVSFNGNYWVGAWSNGYPSAYKSGLYYPIGFDSRVVTDELQDNPSGEPEMANFQERYTTNKNGFTATNAILIVEKQPILAGVTFDKKKLNLNSNGILKAFITLPEGYDVSNIDINTVKCEGAEALVGGGVIPGKDAYEAKFKIPDLTCVEPGLEVELTVTGKLFDGTPFEGSNTLEVV